jgi:hypothetical protein
MKKSALALVLFSLVGCGDAGSGMGYATLSDSAYEPPGVVASEPAKSSVDTPANSTESPGCAGQEAVSSDVLATAVERLYCDLAVQCAGKPNVALFISTCAEIKNAVQSGDISSTTGICAAQLDYCIRAIRNVGCSFTAKTTIPGCVEHTASQSTPGTADAQSSDSKN